MSLTDFLLARIAEDESRLPEWFVGTRSEWMPIERIKAECEAKRRIVERCSAVDYAMPSTHLAHGILAELAAAYADHPDYDPAWRP